MRKTIKLDSHHLGWKVFGLFFVILSLSSVGYRIYSNLLFGQKQRIQLSEIKRETKIQFPAGSMVKESVRYQGLPYSYIVAEIHLPPGDESLSQFRSQPRLQNEGWGDHMDSAAAICHKVNSKVPDWKVETPGKSVSILGSLLDIGGTSILIDLDNPQRLKVFLCVEKNE